MVLQELGKRWHDMKEEDKRPYFEMAAVSTVDYCRIVSIVLFLPFDAIR